MYGITDESQLIDIETIKNGCEAFINAMDSFSVCSKEIMLAADICNKKVFALDDYNLEYPISELSNNIANIKKDYVEYANNLYNQALEVYNEQIQELAQYKASQQNASWLEMM